MNKGFLYFLSLAVLLFSLFLLASSFYSYSEIQKSISSRAVDKGTISLIVGSAEEEPGGEQNETSGSGSSGGGGGATPIRGNESRRALAVEIDNSKVNLLNFEIVVGTKESKTIKLINTGDEVLVINLVLSGLSEIAQLETTQVTLMPGEEKQVIMNILSGSFGIYSGKLTIESGDIVEEISFMVNVISDQKLFDVLLSIPQRYRYITEGEDIEVIISITPLGGNSKTNLSVTYLIKDFSGNNLFTEKEEFVIDESYNYVRSLQTSRLHPGEYTAGVEVIYPGGFAASSAHFEIKGKTKERSVLALTLIIAVILGILITLIIYRRAARDTPKKK